MKFQAGFGADPARFSNLRFEGTAALKAHIEEVLGGPHLSWREHGKIERVSTGISELDAVTGGLPRGAITELYGPACSGRTSLVMTALACATSRGEICALIDCSDTFDPASAQAAGVDLRRVLWVRCANGAPPSRAENEARIRTARSKLAVQAQPLDRGLKIADLLIQGGGFGLVILDLADIPASIAKRIPLASWYRFRRSIENTPAVMLVVEQEPTAKACASMLLEMRKQQATWSGTPGCSYLLRGARLDVIPRKTVRSQAVSIDAKALA